MGLIRAERRDFLPCRRDFGLDFTLRRDILGLHSGHSDGLRIILLGWASSLLLAPFSFFHSSDRVTRQSLFKLAHQLSLRISSPLICLALRSCDVRYAGRWRSHLRVSRSHVSRSPDHVTGRQVTRKRSFLRSSPSVYSFLSIQNNILRAFGPQSGNLPSADGRLAKANLSATSLPHM